MNNCRGSPQEDIEAAAIRSAVRLLTDITVPLNERLDKSLDFILKRIKASKGSIMLKSSEQESLRVEASTNHNIIGIVQDINPGSISGYVFYNSVPLMIEDISKSDMFKPRNGRSSSYRTTSLLCVPLQGSQNNTIGVINCSDRDNDSPFTSQDFQMVQEYASWISPLVENSCLMDKIREEKERYKALVRELELKQRELLIAHTERSELVQMVVHDFKSPLSAVISNLDLLKYMGVNQNQDHVVQTARNGASKLFEMINEFLEVARLDQWSEENKGRLAPVDLLPVVQQVVQEAWSTLASKSLALTLDQAQDIKVVADNMLLSHLLGNLISNAVKYTPEGGLVKVWWEVLESRRSADKYNRLVKIGVQDNGPGVPDDLKNKVFDRFTRAERDKNIQGTGIGLFICNRIATMLEGHIWVEDAPGGGSIFCVTMYSPD
ncbi:GAF sensor signal transduction histidine kinase [Desulfonatronospira thiodismutans ASO3-1]|uniref:histidine kinase n=2 Tax=Desulfonatronospira TaxID=488937 RepID=D6STM6_9BACT|nr:GAF domain-containing sensor histidine kinase [Desulfonatronospira thiodismutans]EFI34042.1 GAF sensor signal transduction histidine kinase [Desulfonatronospira thiodismutans ASO3-1]